MLIINLSKKTRQDIYKRYLELGSVSFVHTEFSRRIRGLSIEAVQNAIEEERKKDES
jgi:hypothetical protein